MMTEAQRFVLTVWDLWSSPWGVLHDVRSWFRPKYIFETSRPLRLSRTGLLSFPRVKTKHREAAPHIWNKVPDNYFLTITIIIIQLVIPAFPEKVELGLWETFRFFDSFTSCVQSCPTIDCAWNRYEGRGTRKGNKIYGVWTRGVKMCFPVLAQLCVLNWLVRFIFTQIS